MALLIVLAAGGSMLLIDYDYSDLAACRRGLHKPREPEKLTSFGS
jgi:hypothetical protein